MTRFDAHILTLWLLSITCCTVKASGASAESSGDDCSKDGLCETEKAIRLGKEKYTVKGTRTSFLLSFTPEEKTLDRLMTYLQSLKCSNIRRERFRKLVYCILTFHIILKSPI